MTDATKTESMDLPITHLHICKPLSNNIIETLSHEGLPAIPSKITPWNYLATAESGEKLQAAEDIEDSGPCWSLSAGVVQNGGPHGSHVADIIIQHGGPLGSHAAVVVDDVEEGVPRES